MTRRHGPARWIAARLGLFAVLFQAILFGWHHHDPVRAGHLPMPVVANPTTAPQAVDDEDSCEICQVLHHLTAAPLDWPTAMPPRAPAARILRAAPDFVGQLPTLAFRARAPPLV
jgi:hypothetical protein